MEACSCIVVDDYDSADFYNSTIRKARKIHQCSECEREIMPNETYEYVVGKWDKKLMNFKTCSDCLSIRTVFFCAGFMHQEVIGGLVEHVGYMDGQISSSCLIQLTPRAREFVCEVIEEKWKELDEDEED